ncbi:MAG: hypothetical protein E7160_03820 [Firmicutes bacterium]|nr:hypothetical protein [Bacillota bacterium]
MKDLVFKKCFKCGALVQVLDDCVCFDCGIMCCGEEMREVKANTADSAVEKHVPVFEVCDDYMNVSVNHVMEPDHYIEWIFVKTENGIYSKKFMPGDEPCIRVPYDEKAVLYSYCNEHGLWKREV